MEINLINYLIKNQIFFWLGNMFPSSILNIKDFICLVKLGSLLYSHKYTKELD